MKHLIALELIKIGKRWLTWILLALLMGAIAATLIGFFVLIVSTNQEFLDSSGRVVPHAEMLPNFVLPGALRVIVDQTQQVGSWLLVVLTATIVGMEDANGTLRVMLSTGLSRMRYLAAKLGALLAMIVVFVIAALIVGVAVAALLGATSSTPIRPVPVDRSLLLVTTAMVLRTVGVLCIPVMLTFCATVLTRSQGMGIMIGLGYFLVEAAAARVLGTLGDAGKVLSALVPGRDITAIMALNRLNKQVPVSLPDGLPSVPLAVVVLLGYTTLLVLGTWLIFRRRDITGSTT